MTELSITTLHTSDADFERRFMDLITWNAGDMADIERRVAQIIADVRQHGDRAVIDYTQRFDRITLTPEGMAFSEAELEDALATVPHDVYQALELAAQRIYQFHSWQLPQMGIQEFMDASGTLLGQRVQAVKKAGLYVPGGLASYPSSVLMNAIPAKVAGVETLIMVVPTPDNQVNPAILAAARLAGVDKIFRIGGAQAVAAMAYGTQQVPAVDMIVGPGNIYVATAKRQVYGQVGIDMIAGPSEILVIADNQNDPKWIAADLLSQAEHDRDAQSILVTDDATFAEQVRLAIAEQLSHLSRSQIARQSIMERGGIIVVKDLDEGAKIASRVAPEHLELAVADPRTLMHKIDHAGAIFMGRHTPEPIGDYVAGPNHVLPTNGTARFSSPLGVHNFIKRSSLIGCTARSFASIGPAASALAGSEGLTAHKLSVDLRLAKE
ncbi:histidinol dehydrogenase [Magnetococcus marinus MC-1]|uniref:Histidinol dehydrogenase n=1 Tax=Magnetococcus marinus (strain ATCC BAA-1437 / JCM 17883 / MC-1) TaxID=156889 RepID=A0L6Y8_MAGMM|nr:histidinol dehydrogenase [Magnetococcus marinus]ABK43731.1 histidinol dehydrogenase [Magnetococcus marinus MC-1]